MEEIQESDKSYGLLIGDFVVVKSKLKNVYEFYIFGSTKINKEKKRNLIKKFNKKLKRYFNLKDSINEK